VDPIWDQIWGRWKTQLVITCDNNSEPVEQRGIKHLKHFWKGIRLQPQQKWKGIRLLPQQKWKGIRLLPQQKWKGIRLLPLLPSYVSLVKDPRLSR
jgi:hypothetical protein